MPKYINACSILFCMIYFSCSNPKSNKQNNSTVILKEKHQILKEETFDIPGKSQLIVYVLSNDTTNSEEVLKSIAMDVYNTKRNTDLFQDHQPAKVIAIFIFNTKKAFETDRNKWVTMLFKGLNNPEPEISYNLPKRVISDEQLALLNSDQNTATIPTIGNYEIIDEEKSETSGKSQLIEYVLYKDTVYNESVLRAIMQDIYDKNKDKNVFSLHDKATVLAIYLFTSKIQMNADKSGWISMLVKGPQDSEPQISFNEFKIKAFTEMNGGSNSIAYKSYLKIVRYLENKGLELCSFSRKNDKVYIENINKADRTHPDYGMAHQAMVDKLDEDYKTYILKKYKISSEMFDQASTFASGYCK